MNELYNKALEKRGVYNKALLNLVNVKYNFLKKLPTEDDYSNKTALNKAKKLFIKENKTEYKKELSVAKTILKEAKKDYKDSLKALSKNDRLTTITDFSYTSIKKEYANIKQIQKQYKKYENKVHLTYSEKEDRKLNKLKYKIAKSNWYQAFKLALTNIKNNKSDNYKEELKEMRKITKFYDELYYITGKLKELVTKEHLAFGRIIITIVSLASLALSLSYIRAIQQVTTSQTGIFMFGFILFGLISIFNVIRLKEAYSSKYFFMLFVLLATLACGVLLIVYIFQGIQSGVKVNLIYQGVAVTIIICIGYIIGLVFITKQRLKDRKIYRKEINNEKITN